MVTKGFILLRVPTSEVQWECLWYLILKTRQVMYSIDQAIGDIIPVR